MSIELSIARASMDLSEFRIQQAIDITMIKKNMELQEQQIESLISNLPAVTPPSRNIIDVTV